MLGQQIGPYRILEVLGEGGFGTVYRAEQREPVRRFVALKVIKLGMDTRAVIARFKAERQALAVMEHPNIARVLDAGATETGRPYFVMELVRGVPITEYCDTHNLSMRDRLELFVLVCNAVQHAHTKGVIHRDLKPSNVLVSMHESRPVPKVIDFGIAKATVGRLTDKTVFTELRQFIGTPEYMSPEQAEMTGLDVDTRSDVYSLGVLMYELLTGTTPLERERLRTAGANLQRIIREEEPPRPSQRLSTLASHAGAAGHTIQDVARHRRSEPQRLARELRGELDWIALRALEKDRTQRYETASALSADVQRYLNHELIQARPAGTAYRVRKFVRRHKVGVAAAAAVAAALLLGLAAAIYGLMEARAGWRQAVETADELDRQKKEAVAARERAELARADADEQRHRAEQESQIAQSVTAFLQWLLAQGDPNHPQHGPGVTLSHLMQDAAGEIETGTLREQPLIEAAIRIVIGDVYRSLGEFDLAENHIRKGLETRRRLLADDDPSIAQALYTLGLLQVHRDQDAEAVASLQDALNIYRANPGEWQSERVDVLRAMAYSLEALGQEALALEARRELADLMAMMDANPNLNLVAMYDQATALFVEDKFAEAQAQLEELIAYGDKEFSQGPVDWNMGFKGNALHLLGLSYMGQEKHEEAETALRDSLATLEAALGPTHPDLIGPLRNLQHVVGVLGRKQDVDAIGVRLIDIEIAGVDRGIAVEPSASLHARRAELLLAAGRISDCAAAYDDAIEAGSTDHIAWYRSGHAHLYAGETDEYLRIAQEMLTRFSDSDRSEILERSGKLALLSADTPHLAAATALIDKARVEAPESLAVWFDMSKALADFRAGKYQDALLLLSEPARSLTVDGQICAQSLTAMCHWHLGDREKARALLKSVEDRIDRELPKAGEAEITGVENWIAAHILLRQAQQLITSTEGSI
jgi:tetratricopeptide (TPR) repeat protein